MIFTARQLEELHRTSGGNGQITLPYRARLTPLATDFLRARKISIGYGDVEAAEVPAAKAPGTEPPAEGSAAPFLWWCDGPCGPAKAAITALAKENPLRAMDEPADAGNLIRAIKSVAANVKAGRAAGAVLIVKSGAAAVVYANRCQSLRAILGTCIDSVDQGLRLVAANVLVIEHPYVTLQQAKNLTSRFLRGPRNIDEQLGRQLAEVASCG